MKKWLLGIIFLLTLLPLLATAQDTPEPVQTALDDLNTRLGLNLKASDVTWRYHQNVYNDSSLGCPQPNVNYFKGKTVGYSVEFDVQGVTYDYRLTADLTLIFCNAPFASDPTGTASFNGSIRPTRTAGSPTGTRPVRPTITAQMPRYPLYCSDNLPVHVIKGLYARVVAGQTAGLYRDFDSPEPFGELASGDRVIVLEGPFCGGDIIWWRVDDSNTGDAYIREYEDSTYHFEPLIPSYYYATEQPSTNSNATAGPKPPTNVPTSAPMQLTVTASATVTQVGH